MNAKEIVEAVGDVLAAFDELEISYFLTGSVVSSFYGNFRSTNDVDVVAQVAREHAEPLADRLSNTYFIDPDMIVGAVARRKMFNVIRLSNMLKVDVYVPGDAQREMARSRLASIGGTSMRVASPEDCIASKLSWYRLGGETSEKQWGDVRSVLAVQITGLDLDYLRSSSRRRGVEDLLDRALAGR